MATLGRRRAYGQHFLKDLSVATQIAETALSEASRSQCIGLLEIGPGKGAITTPILERLSRFPSLEKFLLVEKDQRLAADWSAFKTEPRLVVESEDFLEIRDEKWLGPTPLAVVSNLPYSSGTAILDRLARHFPQIPVMVLMFQAEVARRLRAEPSTKERGSLSIWIQNRWDVQKLLLVPPQAFSPPPEVNSEVVVLRRREKPRIEFSAEDENLWESFLKTCFAHRRKMLRSVLPWRNALELSGVDGTKRAEALQWSEWEALFHSVRQIAKPSKR